MSGECYLLKQSSETKKGNESNSGRTRDKAESEIKQQLAEYENSMDEAENKCGQRKGKLELLKEMYSGEVMRASLVKSQISRISQSAHSNRTDYTLKGTSSTPKPFILPRQSSKAIGTEHGQASLCAISSIMEGISETIRSSDVYDQASIKNKSSPKSIADKLKPITNKIQTHFSGAHGVATVKINTKLKSISNAEKSRAKIISTPSRVSSKISSMTSSHTVQKTKVSLVRKISLDRKSKNGNKDGSSIDVVPMSRNRSRKAIKRQRSLPTKSWLRCKTQKKSSKQDLVEIYHNVAVKESNSSDSNETKNKNDQDKKIVKQKDERPVSAVTVTPAAQVMATPHVVMQKFETVPPLDIYGTKTALTNAVVLRNYEQPTISSRLKRVAKYYINSFRSIPFCAATSINPSHNIGINIQQMMNMMKHRHNSKLSPTLAFKIGCAADTWDLKTLLGTSSVSTRVGSQCPMSKMSINYQYMQEAAKTVPQETIEEVDEDLTEINSPATQSLYITGPSGDVKVQNKKQTNWSVQKDEAKCTCLPQKGRDLHQIVDKYIAPSSSTQKTQASLATEVRNISKSEDRHPSKRRKLKDVLQKLHDEFSTMNKRYEELSKKSNEKGANVDAIRYTNGELERLDRDLNSKEEEIMMVMSLYEEVLALKKQVQNLKERTSKEAISVKSQVSKINDYTTSNASSLLQRLLRQVQQFQSHYNTFRKI